MYVSSSSVDMCDIYMYLEGISNVKEVVAFTLNSVLYILLCYSLVDMQCMQCWASI